MEITLFAASDFHLGMTFAGYGSLRNELERARYEALNTCVETANSEDCQIFCIAGDLFDKQNLPASGIDEALDILRQFKGDCICMLPGNHDYLSGSGSALWNRVLQFSDDRMIVMGEFRPYDLTEYNVDAVCFPGPCDSKTGPENRIQWISGYAGSPGFLEAYGGKWKLGIAHGSVEGLSPDTTKRYFPMTPVELRQTPVDVWIIGHTHLQYPPADGELGEGSFLLPGTPEPDGFDCRHEGKAWLVRLYEADGVKRVRVTAKRTGSLRFADESGRIHSAEELGVLEKKVLSAFPEAEKTFLRLELTGQLEKDRFSALEEMRNRFKEKFLYSRIEDSGVSEIITPEDIDNEFTAGSFPHRLLKELSAEEDTRALQIAYELLTEVRG